MGKFGLWVKEVFKVITCWQAPLALSAVYQVWSFQGWLGNPLTIILGLLLSYNVAITKENYKAYISTWKNGRLQINASVEKSRTQNYKFVIIITKASLVAQTAKSWLIRLQYRRSRFNPWIGKIPWRRKWQPTPLFLPGKSHGQRSLAGYSPWGCKSQTRLSD